MARTPDVSCRHGMASDFGPTPFLKCAHPEKGKASLTSAGSDCHEKAYTSKRKVPNATFIQGRLRVSDGGAFATNETWKPSSSCLAVTA